jgi:hypothetical protein
MMMTMPLPPAVNTYQPITYPSLNNMAEQPLPEGTVAPPIWASPYPSTADTFTPSTPPQEPSSVLNLPTMPEQSTSTPLSFPWFNTAPTPVPANTTILTSTSATTPMPMASSSYTPAFTKTPEAPTTDNQQLAWLGKHPTATALGVGIGSIGGGIVGASINHTVNSQNSATSTSSEATVKANPGFDLIPKEAFHPDNKTPKFIKDANNERYYEISANQEITGTYYYQGGEKKSIYTPNTEVATIKIPTIGDMTISTVNNKVTLTRHNNADIIYPYGIPNPNRVTHQLTDEGNGVRRYQVLELPMKVVNGVQQFGKSKTQQQYLLHNSGIAIELNPKGEIVQVLDTRATGSSTPKRTQAVLTQAIERHLTKFSDAVLPQKAKQQFIDKTKRQIPVVKMPILTPAAPETAFSRLEKETKSLLQDLHTADLRPTTAIKKTYENCAELLRDSGITLVPPLADDAKADWGKTLSKATPGLLIGATVGGAVVFGVDYWLQHRKTSVAGNTNPQAPILSTTTGNIPLNKVI